MALTKSQRIEIQESAKLAVKQRNRLKEEKKQLEQAVAARLAEERGEAERSVETSDKKGK
jgi:phage FluMu protein gp41